MSLLWSSARDLRCSLPPQLHLPFAQPFVLPFRYATTAADALGKRKGTLTVAIMLPLVVICTAKLPLLAAKVILYVSPTTNNGTHQVCSMENDTQYL